MGFSVPGKAILSRISWSAKWQAGHTDAALKELNALKDRDFVALVAETKGNVR
jgi:predicted negative regulator of RcsB-dependent stress response